MTFFKTIRGVEVEIHAEQFDEDPSVGIPYGPVEVWATTLVDDGHFELTDEEYEQLGIEAAEIVESSQLDDII